MRNLPLEAWTQIRRCHRCHATLESNGERVVQCAVCRAHFAPFYFAEFTPDALLGSARTPFAKPQSPVFSNVRNYRPVIGLTWWWVDSAAGGTGELLMPRA